MKKLIENAALYRQRYSSVKLPWLIASLGLLAIVVGCQPGKPTTGTAENKPTSPAVTVPLRVWFVANSEDKPVIERQWQAADDRPAELTIFTVDELLKQDKPRCDAIVYPASLVGELISRKWIAELPAKLQATLKDTNDNSMAIATPAAWLDQAGYDRRPFGVSLSVLTPVIMANYDLPKARDIESNDLPATIDPKQYWHSVIAAQKAANERANVGGSSDPYSVDEQAVCDRFLTILFSISSNDNKIGNLFQPDDLKPRVKGADFVAAATIMKELRQAGVSGSALMGSHEAAWRELASSTPQVTIGLPPVPSAEVDKINSIQISPPPAAPVQSGMRLLSGWNSGRGLVGSVSRQCRQTDLTIDYLRWLSDDTTRQVLAKRMPGIQGDSTYAPGSSAWQADRVIRQLASQLRLPAEPRLPRGLEYRHVLGEQIAKCLTGNKSIEDALADVEKAWQEITDKADRQQQSQAYLQSLGL